PLRYGAAVGQLSFFSADVAAPTLADLGGLLAAHGQVSIGEDGSRLSIVVPDQWRATALADEFNRRELECTVGVAAEQQVAEQRVAVPAVAAEPARPAVPVEPAEPAQPGQAAPSSAARPPGRPMRGYLVRSARTHQLDPLAAAWTRGSVKTVPPFPVPTGGFLRCWALAAGRAEESGYLLGIDEHASQMYPRLAAGLAAVGLTGAVIGSRGGGPGIRVVGRRRLGRLVELLGDPPAGAPADCFPSDSADG
ncbi:MAG: hypothetical protein M3Y77_14320, partial [Actinomycetota bacterium]|nr:hypothetical protein [Actinomycetota bacterium]